MSQIYRPVTRFRVAAVFSHHMVLQRGEPIRIFGEGVDGTCVRVCLEKPDGVKVEERTIAQNDRWLATLPPQEAADGCTLTVTAVGGETRCFQDVSIGEVWLAGGQSNMEFELQNCKGGQESLQRDHAPAVRFYQTPRNAYKTKEFYAAEENSSWQLFDSESSSTWSAVGYYFAKKLSEDLGGVTVGVIGCNLGGTSASAWISRDVLLEDQTLSCYVTEFDAEIADIPIAEQERQYDEYLSFHTQWDKQCADLYRENPGIEWGQAQEILGPCRYPGPKSCKSPFRPGGLYACMLQRIAPYTLAGCIFYQGESDDHKPMLYRTLFTKLIELWRRDFMNENLPFIFTQLTMHRYRQDPDFGNWPIIRQAQQQVYEAVPYTGMAVIVDKGEFDNIHPLDKKPVGERLCLQALAHVYGKISLAQASGPCFHCAYRQRETVRVEFEHAADGLVASGEVLTGFEIAGEDGFYRHVEAQIEGSSIRIDAPDATSVRYLWSNYAEVDLFGKNGLPAAPFSAEITVSTL